MSIFDLTTLSLSLLLIAVFGIWKTRRSEQLDSHLRDRSGGWLTIGLSVMATQASAITFLSTPGLAYGSGMGFVQNYFGLPFALIVVSAVFVPAFYRLNVYSAYEYLEKRFDRKTRLLGAVLFLIQRGLAAGITIYAPSIILTNVLDWDLNITVFVVGLLVIGYTVSGGSKAVNVTHRLQMAVILMGMGIAFAVALFKIGRYANPVEALSIAGIMGKLEIVSFSFDLKERYTVWSGLFGGFFLALSYFGTDQSQVQRYLSGRSIKESRFGLLFNAFLKVPLQFCILLMGVFVFLFYQFEKPPVSFSPNEEKANEVSMEGYARYDRAFSEQKKQIDSFLEAREEANSETLQLARNSLVSAHNNLEEIRFALQDESRGFENARKANESDYIFIHFVLNELPVGLVGLLVAVILCAAMSSTASELNALSTVSIIDFYREYAREPPSETQCLRASRLFTALWGGIAICFALFASMVENLIEAVNIVGSLFYGTVLGIFVCGFFLRRVKGYSVFVAAIIAQGCVLLLYFVTNIGYLWYNVIGCVIVMLVAASLQFIVGGKNRLYYEK